MYQMYQNVLSSELFRGIAEKDLSSMLRCLNARQLAIRKGDYILRPGEKIENIGIVLHGTLQIMKEDTDGDRTILAQLEPGSHFAEAFCCAGIVESPISIRADTDAAIMLLDFTRILHTCTHACVFHTKLIENMLFILANKNVQLQTRMEFLSKKTIRKRLLKYIRHCSNGTTNTISIPFNREELANYLCVDRSALSRELAQLKKEGILDYWKNQFKLLK